MAKEAPDLSDDAGHMPSLSSKSRETGELQDMYRRTLAASWAAQPGVRIVGIPVQGIKSLMDHRN